MKNIKIRLFRSFLKIKKTSTLSEFIGDINTSVLTCEENEVELKLVLGLPGVAKDDIDLRVSNNVLYINIKNYTYYHEVGYIPYWSIKNSRACFDFNNYPDVNISKPEIVFVRGMLSLKFEKIVDEKVNGKIKML